MPRRAHLSSPNVAVHIIERGNNRQACFFADPGARYQLDANYGDGMYDFRLYELTRAGKRALPVGVDCQK